MFYPHDCYSSSRVHSSWFAYDNLSAFIPARLKGSAQSRRKRAVLCKSAECFGPIDCTTDPGAIGPASLDIISKLTPLLFAVIYFHIFAVPSELLDF
ncbi:LOW QUALITY PROTEIN: fatty acid hydroxylase, putative [Aspergillus lentulus]|nr:LOW QUALITY PROTEIN: fatty acid hydroxylase, putative [Aspergillus lentulus]